MSEFVISLFRFLKAIINGMIVINEQRQLIAIKIQLIIDELSEIVRIITRYEKINSVADFPVVRRISASKKVSIQI